MFAASEIVEPVKVPSPVLFSATPDKLTRSSTLPSISVTTEVAALSSSAVSSACKAAFSVLLSAIVAPVKVPRFALSLATPVRVATLSMCVSLASIRLVIVVTKFSSSLIAAASSLRVSSRPGAPSTSPLIADARAVDSDSRAVSSAWIAALILTVPIAIPI